MDSVLITGSSRGLGLAFLSKEFPDRVIPVQLDVTNQVSIKKAASEVEAKLEGKGLDVLINNAAVCYYSPGLVETIEKLEESFLVNVMGVHWWIKTELGGGDHADLTPEQAAKASLEIVFTEGQVYNGKLPIVAVEGFEKPR
ncbi:hypothetical protein VTI28DRAFT_8829 [Corynascus sepedonium]